MLVESLPETLGVVVIPGVDPLMPLTDGELKARFVVAMLGRSDRVVVLEGLGPGPQYAVVSSADKMLDAARAVGGFARAYGLPSDLWKQVSPQLQSIEKF